MLDIVIKLVSSWVVQGLALAFLSIAFGFALSQFLATLENGVWTKELWAISTIVVLLIICLWTRFACKQLPGDRDD